MLEIEKRALYCLTLVRFGVFSRRKHFVQDLSAAVSQDPNGFKLTKNQALYFWYIVDRHRRQIANAAVKHFAAERVFTGEIPSFYMPCDLREPTRKPSSASKRSVPETAQPSQFLF